MRFVVEGEWTGYTSAQQRIVHREVVTKKRAERLDGLFVVFTDGTGLRVWARLARHREKVKTLDGYGDLIRRAERTGQKRVTVLELERRERAAREGGTP